MFVGGLVQKKLNLNGTWTTKLSIGVDANIVIAIGMNGSLLLQRL